MAAALRLAGVWSAVALRIWNAPISFISSWVEAMASLPPMEKVDCVSEHEFDGEEKTGA